RLIRSLQLLDSLRRRLVSQLPLWAPEPGANSPAPHHRHHSMEGHLIWSTPALAAVAQPFWLIDEAGCLEPARAKRSYFFGGLIARLPRESTNPRKRLPGPRLPKSKRVLVEIS